MKKHKDPYHLYAWRNMLTIFKIPSYKEDDERPIGNWIAKMLYDVVNNNPLYELKDRENSRRVEAFDVELRKGLVHVKEDECSSCGRPTKDYYKLKPEGHTFVVEKAVAQTVREAAEKLFPKLLSPVAKLRNATEDFLKDLPDISEAEWKKLNEGDSDASIQAAS